MAKARSETRQVHQYDKVLRENMEATLPGLIKNVLGIHIAVSEELPDDLQHTKERHPDVLKKVTDQAGDTFVLHIEFQVSDELKMIYRMAEYFVMLHRQYQLDVLQYIIYIGPGTPTMPVQWRCKQMQFHYQLIALSQIDYQLLLSASDPREKILAILADFKGEDPTAITEQIAKQVIETSDGQLSQNKHMNQLRILAKLRNLDLRTLPIMDSILPFIFEKEKEDILYIRGEKKGLEKGRKAIVNNLLRSTDFTIARIASLAEVTEDFVLEVKSSLH